MKKAIKQIFILPVLSFILTLIVFLFLFNMLLHNIAEQKFIKEKEQLIKIQKDVLKNEINAIILGIDQLRDIGYSLAYREINVLMNLIYKQKTYKLVNLDKFIKRHQTKDLFFWVKQKNTTFPKNITFSTINISGKKYNIAIYDNKQYLITSKKDGNLTIGVAFSMDVIRNSIERNIFKFLDRVNKGKVSYIAMGKILTWNPKKGGIFGKIIYMPAPFKKFIGKPLSYNKPDIQGVLYRKKYFDAFKHGRNSIYVKYYFKNPVTKEYELKYSYFKIYKPYNWVIVKGFYESQIETLVEKSKKEILQSVKNLFLLTAFILLIISVINFLVAFFISKRIIKFIINEYETLENNYKKSQQELIKRVYYDALTGLPNRSKLLEDINGYESLCIVDIDDFSDLNDIYGFEVGDEVLKLVAEYLKNKYKNVYKIGSDEYAIGFDYKVTAEKVREIVNTSLMYKSIKINFSVGASHVKGKLFETAETALKLAYKDKSLKYKIYDESMQKKQKERLEKLQQLSKIIEKGDIIPYYQCIVDREGKIVKYEALMRIKLGDEILSPYQFMQFIKEAKLYNQFSKLMIEKIFDQLPKLNKPVSINLSFYDISNPETSRFILEKLQQNINAEITFEILETENIEQFDTVIEFILNVKKYGAKIAIDDFGSGYSNLVNILYLKPDYLKIDASLVKNIDTPMYYEIVKFIVEFAKKFKIKTVAEFISDKEKFETLKSLGIDEFQGFYFCKPEPIDKLL